MYRIDRAAVIGAGTVGPGIAGQFANAGVDVLLLDIPKDGKQRNAIENQNRAQARARQPIEELGFGCEIPTDA